MDDDALPPSEHTHNLTQNTHDFSTASAANTTILRLGPPCADAGGVGELEQQVLDEYARLDGNMKKVGEPCTSPPCVSVLRSNPPIND
jgi:hypothetical protein